MNAGSKVHDQYGKISTVIGVSGNVVITTAGTYHITKVFAVEPIKAYWSETLQTRVTIPED